MAARAISISRIPSSPLWNSTRSASQFSWPGFSSSRLTSRAMASKVDSELMAKMTEEEKKITGHDKPTKGGPTAQAQKNANQSLNSEVIRDITKGEEKITGNPNPMQAGPTSTAQSILTKVCSTSKRITFVYVSPNDHSLERNRRHVVAPITSKRITQGFLTPLPSPRSPMPRKRSPTTNNLLVKVPLLELNNMQEKRSHQRLCMILHTERKK
jgi:hypothetical protein